MATQPKMIPFGEWLPDLPDYANPGAILAKNCIPRAKSYQQLNSLASFTTALTSAALGAIWLQDTSNIVYNFAGDAQDLYRLDSGTTWTNVSKSLHAYTSTNWEFAKFGNNVLAVDYSDPMQSYVVGSSSAFADQSGSPYNAKRIAVVRDFVVLGDLQAYGPDVIGWSGYNNAAIWTPSRATQSDRQQLFGKGGRVQRIVPGEVGTIFQEHSIWAMEYTGPPLIFQLDEVEVGRGTPAPNSVCWLGATRFYYSHDGFYEFTLPGPSQPIGNSRVDTWITQNSDDASRMLMRGAVDRRNRLVMWAFPSSSSLAYNDRVIIYNWAVNRWSYGELNTELLMEYVSSGLSLDQLDTPFPSGIDAQSINVDSDAYKGGSLGFAAFGTDHKTATFAGSPLTASIDTMEYDVGDGSRVYCDQVTPIVDGTPSTTITVQVGKRNLPNGNVNFDPARAVDSIGNANVRANSRYQRYRVNISGGFSHAQGVRAAVSPAGGNR